ncbi:MAG: hypothetical protein ACEQSA_01470 [Weeksellaceae bacterium]
MLTINDLTLIRQIVKEEVGDNLKLFQQEMKRDIQKLSDQMVEFTEAMIEPTADILNDHETRISKLEDSSNLR